MSFEFKYADEAEDLAAQCDCPPEDATELSRKLTVYRFAFEDCDEDSFIPQAVTCPAEIAQKPCEKRCRYLSLSFYTEEGNAKEAYKFFKKSFKGFVERSGTCLAKGYLEPDDGLVLGPDKHSHLELFEDKRANIVDRFAVTEALS